MHFTPLFSLSGKAAQICICYYTLTIRSRYYIVYQDDKFGRKEDKLYKSKFGDYASLTKMREHMSYSLQSFEIHSVLFENVHIYIEDPLPSTKN